MRSSILSAVIVLLSLITTGGAMALEMTCEYGKRMAIFGDENRDNMIELHWGGDAYQMQRVPTTTGAHRFEHGAVVFHRFGHGLFGIGITACLHGLDGVYGVLEIRGTDEHGVHGAGVVEGLVVGEHFDVVP